MLKYSDRPVNTTNQNELQRNNEGYYKFLKYPKTNSMYDLCKYWSSAQNTFI